MIYRRIPKYPLLSEGGRAPQKISPFESDYMSFHSPVALSMLSQNMDNMQKRADGINEDINKAITTIGSIPTDNPQYMQKRLDEFKERLNKVTSNYGGITAYAATDLAREISKEAASPIYALNKHRLDNLKAEQDYLLKYGPNAIVINTPRNTSIENWQDPNSYEQNTFRAAVANDYVKDFREIIGNIENFAEETGLSKHPYIEGMLQNIKTTGMDATKFEELINIPEVLEAIKAHSPTLQIDNRPGFEWTQSDEGIKSRLRGIYAGSTAKSFTSEINTPAPKGDTTTTRPPSDSTKPTYSDNPVYQETPISNGLVQESTTKVHNELEKAVNYIFEEWLLGENESISDYMVKTGERASLKDMKKWSKYTNPAELRRRKEDEKAFNNLVNSPVIEKSLSNPQVRELLQLSENAQLTKEHLQSLPKDTVERFFNTVKDFMTVQSAQLAIGVVIPGTTSNAVKSFIMSRGQEAIHPESKKGRAMILEGDKRIESRVGNYSHLLANATSILDPIYDPTKGEVIIPITSKVDGRQISQKLLIPANVFPQEIKNDLQAFSEILLAPFQGQDTPRTKEVNIAGQQIGWDINYNVGADGKDNISIDYYRRGSQFRGDPNTTLGINPNEFGKFKDNLINYQYEIDFVGRMEQGITYNGDVDVATRGYVPNQNGQVIGISGVTVGMGVDLGQQTARNLREIGVDPKIISKLTPYLGVKGQAALDLSINNSLYLTREEALELTFAVQNRFLGELRTTYGEKFDKLPAPARSVILSLSYQYGTGGAQRKFNTVIENLLDATSIGIDLAEGRSTNPKGDQAEILRLYQEAENSLRQQDEYVSRRRTEADEIRKSINFSKDVTNPENWESVKMPISETALRTTIANSLYSLFNYNVRTPAHEINVNPTQ